MLGCDGIFDKMDNDETAMSVWRAAHDNVNHPNVKGTATDVHKLCGMGVDYILKNSLLRRSLDNVTVVVVAFSHFKHAVFGQAAPRPDPKEASGKTIERTKSANFPRDYQKIRQEVMQVNDNPEKRQAIVALDDSQKCIKKSPNSSYNSDMKQDSHRGL
jgi:serine/threonine protein phosphatase PrpC